MVGKDTSSVLECAIPGLRALTASPAIRESPSRFAFYGNTHAHGRELTCRMSYQHPWYTLIAVSADGIVG
eukprot:scaffold412_cov388-Prasinococcus_capsulatus_cf.AAC.51